MGSIRSLQTHIGKCKGQKHQAHKFDVRPMPTPLHIAKMHGKRTIVKFFQEKARGVMMTSVTSRKDESDIIQANKRRRRY